MYLKVGMLKPEICRGWDVTHSQLESVQIYPVGLFLSVRREDFVIVFKGVLTYLSSFLSVSSLVKVTESELD